MLEHPLAVHGPLHEAVSHPLHARVGGELPRVHLPGGGLLEYSGVAVAPVLEVGDHEACHVSGSGARAARGRFVDVLEGSRDGFCALDVVARGQPLSNRAQEAARR